MFWLDIELAIYLEARYTEYLYDCETIFNCQPLSREGWAIAFENVEAEE